MTEIKEEYEKKWRVLVVITDLEFVRDCKMWSFFFFLLNDTLLWSLLDAIFLGLQLNFFFFGVFNFSDINRRSNGFYIEFWRPGWEDRPGGGARG